MESKIEGLLNYLNEKKCKDVALYDLKNEQHECDYIIVFSQSNNINNKKFALQFMKDLGIEKMPDGYNKGEWIIFDFDEIVLHSFVSSVRTKYNIDKLWKTKKVDIKKMPKE